MLLSKQASIEIAFSAFNQTVPTISRISGQTKWWGFFPREPKKKKRTFTPHVFAASHDTDSEVASLSLGYTPCSPLLSMQVQPALIWGLGRWSYLKWSRASLSWMFTGSYRRGFHPLKACTRQEIPTAGTFNADQSVQVWISVSLLCLWTYPDVVFFGSQHGKVRTKTGNCGTYTLYPGFWQLPTAWADAQC